jgi:hypothetical protein
LMLGRYLTPENLGEVLARAKHRTKKEIARLVRILDPLDPRRRRSFLRHRPGASSQAQ